MQTFSFIVPDTTTKRKIEASPSQREPEAKQVKVRDTMEHIGDLIVLGLPFKATEKDMGDYFSQFGEVTFVQVSLFSKILKGPPSAIYLITIC